MKKIGLVGGLGPASTVEYYLGLVSRCRMEHGPDVYPEIVIDSVNMHAHTDALERGDYDRLSQLVLYSLTCLKAAGAEIAGVLAMREPQHISLFFVDAAYHRRGIGTRLFRRMKKDYDSQRFTVHASPYALPFYRSLGFRETDCEQSSDGIRYTPMEYHPAKE